MTISSTKRSSLHVSDSNSACNSFPSKTSKLHRSTTEMARTDLRPPLFLRAAYEMLLGCPETLENGVPGDSDQAVLSTEKHTTNPLA